MAQPDLYPIKFEVFLIMFKREPFFSSKSLSVNRDRFNHIIIINYELIRRKKK